ncbi:MAG: PEP-CTERM sorting domain-containing protein, partial [Planctomycetota bacterium]
GVVQSAALSINASGGAGMNISGSGKYITAISQLGNVNYWVNNNIIKANNGAPGWSVVVDTTTDPTKVMLTVVPEPSVTALGAVGMAVVAWRRLRRR